MKKALVAAGWIAVSVLPANGQTQQDAPQFEVASVKSAAADNSPILSNLPRSIAEQIGFNGGPGTNDPGRIDYSKVTLQMLLARAYNLRPDQISGPDWLETERYEIAATLPPGTDVERLRLMLQRLLTERFQITLRREIKEVPVYRLTLAKNGPKLTPEEEALEYKNDEEMLAVMRAQRASVPPGGGFLHSRSFHLRSATVARFAERLSANLDRPVKDMTHLEGLYAFTSSWGWDDAPDDSNPSAPPISAAIRPRAIDAKAALSN